MLTKEMMEKRVQIEELEIENLLAFDMERTIYRLVVSAAVSEEKERGLKNAQKMMREKLQCEVALDGLGKEKEDEEIIIAAIMEAKTNQEGEINDLEVNVADLEKERKEILQPKEVMEKLVKRNAELEEEVCRLSSNVSCLEKEKDEKEMTITRVMEVKVKQEAEILELKYAMTKLNSSLSPLLSEIVKKSGELEGDISQLSANVAVLENEKRDSEMMIADQEAEILHLNEEKKILAMVIAEIVRAMAEQVVKILLLREESMWLHSRLSQLHAEHHETLTKYVATLQRDVDRRKKGFWTLLVLVMLTAAFVVAYITKGPLLLIVQILVLAFQSVQMSLIF